MQEIEKGHTRIVFYMTESFVNELTYAQRLK